MSKYSLMLCAFIVLSAGVMAAGIDDLAQWRFEHIDAKLDLTAEQKTKVKDILTAGIIKLEQVVIAHNDDPRSARGEIKDIEDDVSDDIEILLTDEQNDIFDDLEEPILPRMMLIHLYDRLDLTLEQVDEINRIVAAYADVAEPGRGGGARIGGGFGGIGSGGKLDDRMARVNEYHRQIKDVLTDQQSDEYDKMVAERRTKMMQNRPQGRGMGGGGRGW